MLSREYVMPAESIPKTVELGVCIKTIIAHQDQIDDYIEKLDAFGTEHTQTANSIRTIVQSLYEESEEEISKTIFDNLLEKLRSTITKEASYVSQDSGVSLYKKEISLPMMGENLAEILSTHRMAKEKSKQDTSQRLNANQVFELQDFKALKNIIALNDRPNKFSGIMESRLTMLMMNKCRDQIDLMLLFSKKDGRYTNTNHLKINPSLKHSELVREYLCSLCVLHHQPRSLKHITSEYIITFFREVCAAYDLSEKSPDKTGHQSLYAKTPPSYRVARELVARDDLERKKTLAI